MALTDVQIRNSKAKPKAYKLADSNGPFLQVIGAQEYKRSAALAYRGLGFFPNHHKQYAKGSNQSFFRLRKNFWNGFVGKTSMKKWLKQPSCARCPSLSCRQN